MRLTSIATGDDEALEPLRNRYDTQYYRLLKFYYECSNLRYLTSLITVPELSQDPPNLRPEDDERPNLPKRPRTEPAREVREATPPLPPTIASIEPVPIDEFWKEAQRSQQEAFAREQERLQNLLNVQQYNQQMSLQQATREFNEQQRLLAEDMRAADEQLLRDQHQAQTTGRMAELERANLSAQAQYRRDQLSLDEYHQRLRDLEREHGLLKSNFIQQNASKNDQIRALQEQVNTWRSKYEALAKLYSQLRTEHLDMLSRFKSVQLKAASAQEAVDQLQKLEREFKTKKLELADMIRERDRALHDNDRISGGNREVVEKLNRELRMALDRAESSERSKGSELSSMMAKHNSEIAELEEALRVNIATACQMRTVLIQL